MTPIFSGPEQWLTYVARHLAPFEREEAQAPYRADVARWREEGLSNSEIAARLGDAEAVTAALAKRFVRADEELALRNRLDESPWWVLLSALMVTGLFVLIEYSEAGQVDIWTPRLLLLPACGLLISGALAALRPHLSLRWRLTLLPAGGVWLGPLALVGVTIGSERSPLIASVAILAFLALSVALRYALTDRQTLKKLERLSRYAPAP